MNTKEIYAFSEEIYVILFCSSSFTGDFDVEVKDAFDSLDDVIDYIYEDARIAGVKNLSLNTVRQEIKEHRSFMGWSVHKTLYYSH